MTQLISKRSETQSENCPKTEFGLSDASGKVDKKIPDLMIVYEENLLNGIIALAPLGNFCQWRMEAFGLRTAQMSFFSFSHDFYGDLEHIPNIISHQASMNYLCKLFQRHSGRSQSEASRFPCKQRHL